MTATTTPAPAYTPTPERVQVNPGQPPSRLDARTKLLLIAASQALKGVGGHLIAFGKAIDAYVS